MALPPAKYARGDDKDHSETILDERAKHAEGSATEHSETIIDARGLATQPSDEGKPARIPIIQVAFKNGVWWSIPREMSAALYAKCEAGEDAGYTWDWVTHGWDHESPMGKRLPSIDTSLTLFTSDKET